jgi:hypothetical protein
MESKSSMFEPLVERAEQYGRTSIELVKLKLIDKTADVSSTLISRLFAVLVISFFVLTLNIAIALWLGELLGKNYYGFLIVAAFYGICGIVFWSLHPAIKARVNNYIIAQILN